MSDMTAEICMYMYVVSKTANKHFNYILVEMTLQLQNEDEE